MGIQNNQLSTMQHQLMKCAYIKEVCTHHECVQCFSFEVGHATYHIYVCAVTQLQVHSLPWRLLSFCLTFTVHPHDLYGHCIYIFPERSLSEDVFCIGYTHCLCQCKSKDRLQLCNYPCTKLSQYKLYTIKDVVFFDILNCIYNLM